jgi:hypothetical protein
MPQDREEKQADAGIISPFFHPVKLLKSLHTVFAQISLTFVNVKFNI